ncbi:MAG TPA: hypothetical protein VHS30_20965 [Streptosporangiaceae bacterium]|jgi:broad specificity phosphatase PhoE|nr:hypothetical protein [Streptosporangiaceae bacterium]
MRYVEWALRQRGDRLTPQGAADAKKTGRDLLHPPYDAFVSTGAACAIQMLEIVRHAVGQDDTDHPDDVGQGAWHCTVHLVYGVLHGLVLPVWRGDGI